MEYYSYTDTHGSTRSVATGVVPSIFVVTFLFASIIRAILTWNPEPCRDWVNYCSGEGKKLEGGAEHYESRDSEDGFVEKERKAIETDA